jgi:protein SCO1
MHPRNILVAVILGIALAAGLALFLRGAGSDKPGPALTATVLPAPVSLPDVTLVDDRGEPVDQHLFDGRWNLVYFGFTNCPDICPVTLQTLAQARASLAESGQSPLPRIVFVSVDPERDTTDRIAAYVNSFGEDTLGITGNPDELRKLTEALGIYFAKAGTDPANYSVDHSAVVLLIGPGGQLRALFSAPHTAAQFVHDLPLLMRS